MENKLITSKDYQDWLRQLKEKYLKSQIKAAISVNTELINFYWELGNEIVQKQKETSWGSGFLKQLSHDLQSAFPEMKGFSKRNLEQIRKWHLFWAASNAKQVVALLPQIPWGHNLVIISKCKNESMAAFYILQTIENGWSRAVLTHQIESRLFEREGKAVSNFKRTLPKPQSDLAQQTLKDPYVFDFLSLAQVKNERALEQALINHISNFLLELGAGFAYLGKQVGLKVGEREFYLDLLFYHTQLHCYIVIELKTGEFEPEYAGKLNFYLKAVDELLKTDRDEPTIGLLLCKSKDKVVAEYALSDIHKPMGISEYHLTHKLPKTLQKDLPSTKQIEAILKTKGNENV